MRLSREMHDRIDLLFFEDIAYKIRGTDITLDKLEIRQVLKFVQVREAGTVVELVVDNDVIIGILSTEKNGNMGGDEA